MQGMPSAGLKESQYPARRLRWQAGRTALLPPGLLSLAMCQQPANLVAWSNAWLSGCDQAMPAVCWTPSHLQQAVAEGMPWHRTAATEAPCAASPMQAPVCWLLLASDRPPGSSCSLCQVAESVRPSLVRTPWTPHSVHPGGRLHHPCCLVWRSSPCAPYCPASASAHTHSTASSSSRCGHTGVCAVSSDNQAGPEASQARQQWNSRHASLMRRLAGNMLDAHLEPDTPHALGACPVDGHRSRRDATRLGHTAHRRQSQQRARVRGRGVPVQKCQLLLAPGSCLLPAAARATCNCAHVALGMWPHSSHCRRCVCAAMAAAAVADSAGSAAAACVPCQPRCCAAVLTAEACT